MLLVLDIGNTHITAGILNGIGEVLTTFRIPSKHMITEDEFFSHLKNIAEFKGIDFKGIRGIAIASVVPVLTTTFKYFGKKYFDIDPLIVGTDLKRPFEFIEGCDYSNYGADRIIAVAQGMALHPGRNLVIFDLGTATNYEVIRDGVYIGGGIMPGLEMSFKALFGNTALVTGIPVGRSKSVLGIDDAGQIYAGVFQGYVGQIKHIIDKIKDEVENPYIIMTGGQGRYLLSELEEIDEYIPDLNLQGLHVMYKLNREEK